MINPRKYKYREIIMTADKKQYDVSEMVENVTWEEPENELAARITFTVKNEKAAQGRISSLAKPGCWIGLLYSYNGGKNNEAVRGRIIEWNPNWKNNKAMFRIKAYDVLYDLQESQDCLYFSANTKTKSAISQILKKWGVKLGTYSGPNVKHGKMAFKSEKLGAVILKILKEAKKKGGIDAVLRSEKTTVNILKYGNNATIYHFEEGSQMTEVNHKITTAGMVTRVKVLGKENKNGNPPVEATVNGKTDYGIRQKLYSRGKDESLDAAKKSAKEILADEGKPKETVSVKLPDIPVVRKGDQVHLKTSYITAGFYYVVSIVHDIDAGTMTMDLKKASEYKSVDEAAPENKAWKKGDKVKFKGGTYYVSSGKKAKGSKGKAGTAKIKKIKNGAAHPYYLETTNWKKSKVNGWVDSGSFS